MNPTPVCDLTPSQMFDSMTGFEEIAVVKMFGRPITDYGRKGRSPNPLLLVRALIAVHHKRSDNAIKDPAAYAYAMGLRSDEAQSYFTDEDAEEEAAETDDDGEGDDLEAEGDEGKAPSAD